MNEIKILEPKRICNFKVRFENFGYSSANISDCVLSCTRPDYNAVFGFFVQQQVIVTFSDNVDNVAARAVTEQLQKQRDLSTSSFVTIIETLNTAENVIETFRIPECRLTDVCYSEFNRLSDKPSTITVHIKGDNVVHEVFD